MSENSKRKMATHGVFKAYCLSLPNGKKVFVLAMGKRSALEQLAKKGFMAKKSQIKQTTHNKIRY